MAREFHPDRLGPDASAEARAISEEIFASIVQAYEVLSDVDQRRAYDAELTLGAVRSDSDDVARILAAEEQFRRGDALLRAGQAIPALRALQEAVRLYPDEAEFHACLGWAEWLCSRQDETGAFVADGSLRRALALNPRMDRAYVFRGWILQALARPREAEAEFESALLCNPACSEALRQLRLTGAP
jgi:curved DNA-binding protein CbpA